MSGDESAHNSPRLRAIRALNALGRGLRLERERKHHDEAMATLVYSCPELMGPAEAAACLGVRQSNLGRVRGLPDPEQFISNGRIAVYMAEKVRALADERAGR